MKKLTITGTLLASALPLFAAESNEALITTIQQGITNPDQLCKTLEASASKDQLDWIQKWIAPTDYPQEEADKKLHRVFESHPIKTDILYECLFKKNALNGPIILGGSTNASTAPIAQAPSPAAPTSPPLTNTAETAPRDEGAIWTEIIKIQTKLNTETDWHKAEALRAELAKLEQQLKGPEKVTPSHSQASASSSSTSALPASPIDEGAIWTEIIKIQTKLNTETDWYKAEALRAELTKLEQQLKKQKKAAPSHSQVPTNQTTGTASNQGTNNEALITTIQQGITNPDQLCKTLETSASKDQLNWIQKWIAPMDYPKEEADKKLYRVFTSYPLQTDKLYNCLFKKNGLGGAL